MKKIYGNEYLLSSLAGMINNDRAAHTVIFYGEKGSGRKLMADHYARSLVCTDLRDGRPCGECAACRNAEKHAHPDIMYVETSGKLGGYSVEAARDICADAYIKPNNRSGRKVYIFRDCHKMDSRTQNTLLKIIEEPPDFTYFIFTSESKTDFLPTIISRSLCFAVSPCSEDEARMALEESGFANGEIEEAIGCFHGNVGMCTLYIVDDNLRKRIKVTRELADSIVRCDEYSLNCAFFAIGRERADIKTVLRLLDDLMRDAAVYENDENARLIGCCRECAVRLSGLITPYQAAGIHNRIEKAWSAIESNVSASLVLAALCSEIIGIAAGR